MYCACHAKCIFEDPLQMSHACHRFWKCYKTLTFCSLLTHIRTSTSAPYPSVFCTFDFKICFAPQRHALFRHLNFQKWSGAGVLYILTSKCASRHNGVHFFDISTSKSGPVLVCFVHFDFEMCFAPQRRAAFRHRNFQKWSDPTNSPLVQVFYL